MTTTITNVKGYAELAAFLQQLPAKLRANVMRSALRAAANPIAKRAKLNLATNQSVKTRQLQEGIRVSSRIKAPYVTASIVVRGQHAYVAHWVEFGVAVHSLRKGAKRASGKYQSSSSAHPGFAAKPYMRPALDAEAGASLVRVGEVIKKRLAKNDINASDVGVEIL